MSAGEVTEHRSYGHWSKPQTPGLPRLGLIGTILALGALVGAILAEAMGGWQTAVVWCLMAGPLLLPLLYRNRAGRNGWQIIGSHTAWLIGKQQGQTVYIGGRVGVLAFGHAQLPGLLAKSELLEAEDVHGTPFALVHLPQSCHYTTLIRVEPDGSALVDVDTVDMWVAGYGRWLASLAHEPGLVAATVTVETAPDPGHVLTAEVARLARTDVPSLSKQVLNQIASTYPRGSASITGHVALTYNAKRPRTQERELFAIRSDDKPKRALRSSGEMGALVGSRLPGMVRELAGTGIGSPRAMTAAETAEHVRVAYDPAAATTIAEARAASELSDVTWAQAGPTGAHETWGAYRHDSGTSITWEMVEAPRGVVEARVLEDVLAPSDAIARKRVTLLYRPHDAASSATIADRDVRTAIGRSTARKGETRASDVTNLAAARQTAAEEAAGAGMVRFSMLVTATVTDPERLGEAADAVDQLGRASRLRLRRCYGAQAASFSAALGVGIVPSAHIAVPELVKDWL